MEELNYNQQKHYQQLMIYQMNKQLNKKITFNTLLYLIVSLVILLLSCNDKSNKQQDIDYYEIYNYDNIIVNENKNIFYIDSLIELYPISDYFHGVKIMMFANQGYLDSAQHYYNLIIKKYKILGTFMTMGNSQIIYELENNQKVKILNNYFENSIELDYKNVNIWARIGAGKVNHYNGELEKAEKYFLDAYEINSENSYILELLTRFYLSKGNILKAKMFFDQINSKYNQSEMKILNRQIDSILKLYPASYKELKESKKE